jgi:hypothetical protein
MYALVRPPEKLIAAGALIRKGSLIFAEAVHPLASMLIGVLRDLGVGASGQAEQDDEGELHAAIPGR